MSLHFLLASVSSFSDSTLASSSYEFLITPIAFVHGYPPSTTSTALGWRDTSIPSIKIWEQVGVHQAVDTQMVCPEFQSYVLQQSFADLWTVQAAQLDTHNDDAHSSRRTDPTFLVRQKGKPVNFDELGCSNARHKILFQYALEQVQYRMLHTRGETIFDGYLLARDVYRAAVKSEGFNIEEIKREYELEAHNRDSFGAHRDDVALIRPIREQDASAQVASTDQHHASTDDGLRLIDQLGSVSHFFTVMPHTSMALYAPPERSLPQLPMIQVTQRVFDEAMLLAGVRVPVENHRLLIRRYKMRCLRGESGKRRFFIPPIIISATRLMRNHPLAKFWTAEEVAATDGRGLVHGLERHVEYARTAAPSSPETEPAFLPLAVQGWLAMLHAASKALRYPLPVLDPSESVLVAPAGSAALGFGGAGIGAISRLLNDEQRHPLVVNDGGGGVLRAPVGTAALSFFSHDPGSVARGGIFEQQRHPVLADPKDKSVLRAPSGTAALQYLARETRAGAVEAGAELRHPLEIASPDSVLVSTAGTAALAFTGVDSIDNARDSREGRYPDVSRGATGALIAPGGTASLAFSCTHQMRRIYAAGNWRHRALEHILLVSLTSLGIRVERQLTELSSGQRRVSSTNVVPLLVGSRDQDGSRFGHPQTAGRDAVFVGVAFAPDNAATITFYAADKLRPVSANPSEGKKRKGKKNAKQQDDDEGDAGVENYDATAGVAVEGDFVWQRGDIILVYHRPAPPKDRKSVV